MKAIWPDRRFSYLAVLAACAWLAGCESMDFNLRERIRKPDYQPANIHRLPSGVPEEVRRVAVLPLVVDARGAQATAGGEALQSVLVGELTRAGAFEILAVSAEDLSHATGRGQWTAEEPLPAGFLQRLRAKQGCEAVLFCRLTQYRAYPPLAVGWSLKLVECPASAGAAPRILWAADEVFDAGNPAVANSARRHYLAQVQSLGPLADSQLAVTSPRRFAQYTLHALALTLPPRVISPQVPPAAADVPVEAKPNRPAPGAGGSE